VHTLNGKRLELSTSNLVHIYRYSMAVARHAVTWRFKGQGHTVTNHYDHMAVLQWLCAAAAAGVVLHVI